MSDPQVLANGRYLLVKRLGEGGMATVYRGFDQRLQVWRAIKVMLPEYARKKKIMARFETEAQMMAMLEHPNIVRVYDVDREGDFPYIVMELVEGGCLVDWVEEHGPMPPRLAVDVIVDTCQALQFAHDRKVIHRDIKPHNIMVDRKGVCRLTDFGIARAGDSEDALTKTGAVMGTWGFMAPEQRTDAKHVDGRADIYAMAATLFSLITDQTPMDLFLAGRETSMLEGVPEPLVPILVKATEYRKDDRYPTAQAFAAALLEVRDQLPDDPEDTPALVGEVAPLPPPPEAPEPAPAQPAPAATPSAQGAASMAGGKAATLMPSDSTSMGANYTLPPAEGTSFDEGSLEFGPAGDGAIERQQERNRAFLWLGLGAALIAAVAVLLASAWTLSEEPGEATTAQAVEQAPTPVEAPTGPVDEEQGSEEPPQAEADDAPPGASEAVAGAARPGAATKARRAASEVPPPRRERAGGTTEAAPPTPVPAPQPTPAPPPPKAQAFQSVNVPGSVSVGESLSVRTKVELMDKDVVLHYRPVGGGAWHTKKLGLLMGARATTIAVRPEYADGIEWYLSSEGVTYGSTRQPKITQVKGGSADP